MEYLFSTISVSDGNTNIDHFAAEHCAVKSYSNKPRYKYINMQSKIDFIYKVKASVIHIAKLKNQL